MIEVSSGGLKANIWLGVLPDWTFPAARVLERRLPAPGRRTATDSCAAIELWAATGARAYYGALAATFAPQDTFELVAHLPVSADDGPVLRDTLARKPEVVRLGLPEEYAEGAFLGLLDVDAVHLLGSGTVSLVGARHGAVGSFSNLFRTLGRILARILNMPVDIAGEGVLLAMIQEELAVQSQLA